MSWTEKVTRDFIIITGDGVPYKVDWMNATKLKEYWIAEFTFPNLAGSLVNRRQPRGRRYNLEIFIQGENNIEQSAAFERSADDTRPWTIQHPLYGDIIVQPVGLMFDNTSMNVTKITGQVIETITQDNPVTTVSPIDNILLDKQNLDATFVNSLTHTPSSSDINTLQANNNNYYKTTVPIINVPDQLQDYFNLFNIAKSNINNALASPQLAMQAVQAVINAPALLQVDVQTRVQALSSQFQSVRSNIQPGNAYQSVKPSSKQLYAINAGALLSAQAVAATTPLANNYTNMSDVLVIIDIIINNYNIYIYDLDSIQTPTGSDIDSFIPDYASLIALRSLIDYAISNLFTIALNARRQRTIILEKDYNIILLTHRLYGLDPSDNNINELIANNQWGLNQLLQIRKNTNVTYYI